MVPVSTRTMYGTVCPLTVGVARSAGRWVGSASGTNAPAVFLYWNVTWVGALHSGITAAARPNAVVSQRSGVGWGRENTGPVIGGLSTYSWACDEPRPSLRASSTLVPSRRPVTRP